MNFKQKTIKAITERTATIGVIGLGYVGLPFAVEKAKVDFNVIGFDRNQLLVDKINRGENYISDVDDETLKRLVNKGSLVAALDKAEMTKCDVLIIAVPTPLTKNLSPDLQYIKSVAEDIATYIRPGQLISLESTTYPGTTNEVLLPILESQGKLKVEKDFYLSYSPERVDPGNKRYTTKNTNKVIGAVGPESLDVALAMYSQTIQNVVPVSSSKAAELVKVFENTYRAVNIALVNEMTLLCDRMGLDVWEVLDAAFTKPFGIQPFYPGPGVGGHCIPLDPHYLEWKAKEYNFHTHFIALAGETNRKMPEFVRDKALRILRHSNVSGYIKVLLLGVTYKKDLADWRESPALEVLRLLQQENIDVSYHDPYVPKLPEHKLFSLVLSGDILKVFNLVIITTDHSCIDYNWLVECANSIFDTRNATKNVMVNRDKIIRL